jgi:tetratricopeptide (TPR) repeat protein
MPQPNAVSALLEKLGTLPTGERDAAVPLLSELASEYARAGMPREGLEAVKRALAMASTDANPGGRALAYEAAAMCHYARSDYLMAISSGIDAYSAFVKAGDEARVGHILTTIATACKEIDAIDLAVDALNGCLRIALKTGDQFLEARVRNTLGLVLGDMHRFDEARRHLNGAKSLTESLGRPTAAAKVEGNLGNVHKKEAILMRAQGDIAGAERQLRQAIALVTRSMDDALAQNNVFDGADKAGALGELYYLLGDNTASRHHVERCLQLAGEIKHAHLVAEGHLFLGRLFMREPAFVEAEREFRMALEKSKASEIRKLQYEAHVELAKCLAEAGRHADASTHNAAAEESAALTASNNREAQREVRTMWKRVFSQHPLIADHHT